MNSVPGIGFDPDGGLLLRLQPSAIRFVQPRFEVHRRQIGQFEDCRTRPRAIAGLEILLAPEHRTRSEVWKDVDHPGRGSPKLEIPQPLFGAAQIEQRLFTLVTLGRYVRFRGPSDPT